MSFTDHKITAFAHKIADLPDQPTLPPDELKSRFDACPEELRQSLNAVCDDAARLEARVEGIVVDTFGDTIDKEMLSDELAAELDAKATQTSLSAEAAARESADDALETEIAQKCEVFFGTYVGDGAESQTITLGFVPAALFVVSEEGRMGFSSNMGASYYGGLASPAHPCMAFPNSESLTTPAVTIDGNTFTVYYNDVVRTNQTDLTYFYLALK